MAGEIDGVASKVAVKMLLCLATAVLTKPLPLVIVAAPAPKDTAASAAPSKASLAQPAGFLLNFMSVSSFL